MKWFRHRFEVMLNKETLPLNHTPVEYNLSKTCLVNRTLQSVTMPGASKSLRLMTVFIYGFAVVNI